MEFDLPMVSFPAPLPDEKGRLLGRLQGPLREYRRLPHGGDGIIRAVYNWDRHGDLPSGKR
jgi:hypothetical protein